MEIKRNRPGGRRTAFGLLLGLHAVNQCHKLTNVQHVHSMLLSQALIRSSECVMCAAPTSPSSTVTSMLCPRVVCSLVAFVCCCSKHWTIR